LKLLITERIVGAGQVIPGWEEGLLGMCLNERRILTIPSWKAYGMFSPIKTKYLPHLMCI
jgi:FKBP-type peptidyl-prolyl cis-trans isomerase